MTSPPDVESMLPAAPPHRRLRISSILYDVNRRRCAAHGLHEGREVTCLGVANQRLLLEVAGAGVVELPLSLAVCIEVESAGDGAQDGALDRGDAQPARISSDVSMPGGPFSP